MTYPRLSHSWIPWSGLYQNIRTSMSRSNVINCQAKKLLSFSARPSHDMMILPSWKKASLSRSAWGRALSLPYLEHKLQSWTTTVAPALASSLAYHRILRLSLRSHGPDRLASSLSFCIQPRNRPLRYLQLGARAARLRRRWLL